MITFTSVEFDEELFEKNIEENEFIDEDGKDGEF